MKLNVKRDTYTSDPELAEELSFEEMDLIHGGAPRIVVSEQVSFSKAEEMLAFVRMNQVRGLP